MGSSIRRRRQKPPALLASAASGAAPRLVCLEAHNPHFLDRAIEQMRGAGPEAAIVGDELAIWWRTQKRARTDRRDEAVAALNDDYVGSARDRAKEAARDLRLYAATGWKRDRRRDVAPLEYSGTRKAILFRVMRENGGKPVGADRIRQIVAARIKQLSASLCLKSENVDKFSQRPISQKIHHPCVQDQTKDAAPMNIMTPPNSDEKLLAALRRSPVVEKIIVEDAARAIAERQKIIDARAELERKASVDFPKLDKAVQSAIAGKVEVEKAIQAANYKLNAAVAAKSAASSFYTMEDHRLEQILRDGADRSLFDDFAYDMRTELIDARKKYVGGTVTVKNRATRKDESVGFNNADSVNLRLSAINAAMEEAENLRLRADQSGVAERLAALRATLPEIGAPVIPTINSGN
jgi:DNA-binding NarL/FixJ family response regulator